MAYPGSVNVIAVDGLGRNAILTTQFLKSTSMTYFSISKSIGHLSVGRILPRAAKCFLELEVRGNKAAL